MALLKNCVFHIVLLFLVLSPAKAQDLQFYLGFDQILDNREYFTEYGHPQTIFGARINPGAFFTFDSLHQIHGGLNYMYEFGGEILGIKPQLDLYYSFRSERIDFFAGSFPRKEKMDYPLLLLTDSLNYYRPNMEGASVRYKWEWGSIHSWVDWTGRQSDENRESILGGIDATISYRSYYFTAIATRYHLARTSAADDKLVIRDDGSLVALAGMDLSGRTDLDKLNISSGLVTTYVLMHSEGFVWRHGWLTQLDARWRMFGIQGSMYLGDLSPLLYGDRLYSHGDYGRIDFYMDPFRNSRIHSKIGWNLHWLPGEGLFHSQQLLISVRL
ncbi:MAG: hypothetical protein P1P86_01495 [Bacteroidales bacterium]|nr:hypothetical protein [Bacteroidales bacterium]